MGSPSSAFKPPVHSTPALPAHDRAAAWSNPDSADLAFSERYHAGLAAAATEGGAGLPGGTAAFALGEMGTNRPGTSSLPPLPVAGTRALNILQVASEAAPYVKTGGLGDAVGALSRALARRGHRVTVVLPYYRAVRSWFERQRQPEPLRVAKLAVPMGTTRTECDIRALEPEPNLDIWFVDCEWAFERHDIYGDYGDNIARFALLCRAASEACRRLDFFAEVVHAHDWQAALMMPYVRYLYWPETIGRAGRVFTIHNIAHQGRYGQQLMPATGLGWDRFNAADLEFHGDLSLMKGGVTSAHIVGTVSPRYAREIQTAEFGFGLEGVLRGRGPDLEGILNGLDTDEWDPETDPHIPARYCAKPDQCNFSRGKAICKAGLQRELGLPVEADKPLFIAVTRLDFQKGIELMLDNVDFLVGRGAQVAFLGSGHPVLEQRLREAAAKYPKAVATRIAFDNTLAHRFHAGGDFIMVPSLFEPCGIVQLIALKYGTLPIARETGGLADTVVDADFHPEAGFRGNGFVFKDYNGPGLGSALTRALDTYEFQRHRMTSLVNNAMLEDFTWDRAASAYEVLYARAVSRAQKA